MREINLCLDLRLTGTRPAVSCGTRPTLSGKMLAHALGFVSLKRARMRFFLGHSDFGKDVKNSFAFDFQFPCQIVDSNFTHPPLFSPKSRLDAHHNLTRRYC